MDKFIMKKILLCLLLALSISGYAQVSWNVKAGANLSKETNSNVNMKLGYQLGVGMDYYFNEHWGIQSSLTLITKGYKSKGNYYYPAEWNSDLSKYDKTENRIYLGLPIALAYKFRISNNFKLVFNGGGYMSYGIGGKYKNKVIAKDNTSETYKYNTFSSYSGTEKFDIGLSAETTLEYLNKYTVGVIGEWGLKRTLATDTRNHTYGINIGYKF